MKMYSAPHCSCESTSTCEEEKILIPFSGLNFAKRDWFLASFLSPRTSLIPPHRPTNPPLKQSFCFASSYLSTLFHHTWHCPQRHLPSTRIRINFLLSFQSKGTKVFLPYVVPTREVLGQSCYRLHSVFYCGDTGLERHEALNNKVIKS